MHWNSSNNWAEIPPTTELFPSTHVSTDALRLSLDQVETESLGEGAPPSFFSFLCVHLSHSGIPPLPLLLLIKMAPGPWIKSLPLSFGKQQEQSLRACKYQWQECEAALYGHTNWTLFLFFSLVSVFPVALIPKHFHKGTHEWRRDEGVFPEQACDDWFVLGSLWFRVPGWKQLKYTINNGGPSVQNSIYIISCCGLHIYKRNYLLCVNNT